MVMMVIKDQFEHITIPIETKPSENNSPFGTSDFKGWGLLNGGKNQPPPPQKKSPWTKI